MITPFSTKKHITALKLTLLFLLVLSTEGFYGQCTAGNVYATNSNGNSNAPARRGLFIMNPETEATTFVANLFGGGAAANEAEKTTSAIALDLERNIIWFCTLASSTPKIYSYNLNTGVHGITTAYFSGSGIERSNSINKAAYNPVNKKIYFHNAISNTLYEFDPSTPSAAAVSVGSLSVAGVDPSTGFSGGDIAFDGLGNLTGAFNNANMLAAFSAIYDAAGVYQGINLSGEKIASLGSSPSAVAFLPNGNYIVGNNTKSTIVNTNSGQETEIGTINFGSSDFTSCASPSPSIVVTKSAVLNCPSNKLTYTITVQNVGQFHALNTRLIDALPAGVTLASATLNGVAIPAVNLATLGTTGIFIKTPSAATDGQVFKNETAIIVLICNVLPDTNGAISNQAFVKYNGIESLNLPNNRVPSNDPNTPASDDATVVSGCITVSGTVYNDNDGATGGANGIPKQGVALTLYDAAGTTVIATATTAVNGSYSFSSLPSRDYMVKITLPTGFRNVSSTDATPADGQASVAVAQSSITGVDFGISEVCYNPVTNTGPGIPVNHGITLLKRAGVQNGNWPMIRKSAHTAIESNGKGFVITRMTSDPNKTSDVNHINKIAEPVEGMMVYDLFEKCLKVYDGSTWSCFSYATCP